MGTFVSIAFERTLEVINSYFAHTVIILILTTITGFTLYLRERNEWKRVRFESRINISLNILTGDTLHIRTLLEAPVKAVILSSYARKLVKQAAHQTTLESPFLIFDSEQDAWLVYNELINTISGIYSSHILRAAMEDQINEQKFLIALTWERDAEVRIQKLRVLLVTPETLTAIAKQDVETEAVIHKSRVKLLQTMHEQYQANAWPAHQIVKLPLS